MPFLHILFFVEMALIKSASVIISILCHDHIFLSNFWLNTSLVYLIIFSFLFSLSGLTVRPREEQEARIFLLLGTFLLI